QMMLKLLPENDQRRAIIERSVEQALMMLHEKKGVAAEK
ncbi:cytochrome c biogenesis protein CcmH, partial [Bacillus subtilis]